MFASTKKIPIKYFIYALLVVVLLFVGFNWVASGLSYKLTYKLKMPPLNSEIRTAVDSALARKGWSMFRASSGDLLDLSSEIVADRLQYDYNVNAKDPNQAWKLRKVNCTGYAALQVAIINYLFTKYKDWDPKIARAEWHSSKVYYNGVWLGKYFGYHAYPVVYDFSGNKRFPDACYKDLSLGTVEYLVEEEGQ